jgi:acetate---CoA ligase (ADP-forming)
MPAFPAWKETQSQPSNSLSSLLEPESIAIVGASDDLSRVGGMPLHYLSSAGYAGRVYPVNPRRETVQGQQSFPSIEALPEVVDLAIIAVPAKDVPAAVRACGEAGVRGAIVFSAGFAEKDDEGAELQRQLAEISQLHGIKVCGPNCAGIINVRRRMVAAFGSHLAGDPRLVSGNIAVITQSGAVGAYIFSLARARGVGLSYWITTGNEADTQAADYLSAIAADSSTTVVAFYLEQIRDADRFVAACRLARDHGTALVAMTTGKSEASRQAMFSHTAALASDSTVLSAAFDELGVAHAAGIEELLWTSIGLASRRRPTGRRVGIITISGAVGAMMVDRCVEQGLGVPSLAGDRQDRMRQLLPYATTVNPVDATGNIANTPDVFSSFVEEILADESIDSVLCFVGHIALSPFVGPRLVNDQSELTVRQTKPVWMIAMDDPTHMVSETLSAADIPLFEDPTRAVDVLATAIRRAENHARHGPDVFDRRSGDEVQLAIPAMTATRSPLAELEARRYLEPFGVCFPRQIVARSPAQAADAPPELGAQLTMKVSSPDILHKSDIGGVRVGVTRAMAAQVFGELVDAAKAVGGVRAKAIVVQETCNGTPVIIGTRVDRTFGPVILVGLGGIDAELIGDRAVALAPLDSPSAAALIGRTKVASLITGYRGRAPLDGAALTQLVVLISELAWRLRDQVACIELNPVLVGPDGVVAADALIEFGVTDV